MERATRRGTNMNRGLKRILWISLIGCAAAHADPPRTPEGAPSLEGVWTNASLTTLQRASRYNGLVLAPSEVEAAANSHPQVVRQRTDDEQSERTVFDGADLRGGRGYNAFWIDPGMSFNVVRGEHRTSWIVDPRDGQIPYRDESVRAAAERRAGFDGPETRPLGERCIVNSHSAGPPMLNYLYNNNYEFVQTRDALVIRAEMNNYARVIRIGGRRVHPNIRPLHGDSIARWEGDSLVAETAQFHPLHESGFAPLGPRARVTERFTRVSSTQILYEFTVEDPERYAQPWRGEMSFNATSDLVFEYACHEGNYALPGILAGARAEERRALER
jgi:hypothetical protein